MSTLEGVLRFINVFCAGIAAGTFVLVLFALIPTISSLSPAAGLQFHQGFDMRVDRYNPAAVLITLLTALALLFVEGDMTTTSGVATLIGFVCTIGVIVVSLVFNIPINRRIRGWSVDSVPAEFVDLRQRWNTFHAVRTALGVLALTCYIIAVLAR